MLTPRSWQKAFGWFLIVAGLVFLIGALSARMQGAGACDSPFVVLNAPTELDSDTLAGVDSYLANVYGADDRPHVLAFYSSYSDIHAVIGRMGGEYMADYSGFSLSRIRWDVENCTQDDEGIRARIALASTRFDGADMFGLILHELSHLYGTADGDGADMDASWWEDTGWHAFNGTCGQAAWEAQEHCLALAGLLEG